MGAQAVPNQPQGTQAGGQHQGPPTNLLGSAGHQPGQLFTVLGVCRFGQVCGHIQRRLAGVVKRAVHPQNAGILQTTGVGKPAEFGVRPQCGRRKNPGTVHRLHGLRRNTLRILGTAGRHFEQTCFHGLGNVEWRLDQPQLCAHVHPPHSRATAGRGKTGAPVGKLHSAFVQATKIRGHFTHRVECPHGLFTRGVDGV